MSFTADKIAYRNTGSFSKIVLDYLDATPALKDFYNYQPNTEGIKKAVADRKNFPVNRALLVNVLQKQYTSVQISDKLKANIDALLSENTFTICTAHQPNIFTGHLYFIYKILHAIRLSSELNEAMPENKFVPVYYMGSEDADLEELGEVHINGKHYQWETDQKGAVGRMNIDKAFIKIIDEIEGQLAVEKSGAQVMQSVRKAYTEGTTIEQATFDFVHEMFNEFGLVILLPDNRELKSEFAGIIQKELDEQFSHAAVTQTVAAFPAEYKVQASGRDINLFYLENDIRERIENSGNGFSVANTKLHFTKEELESELKSSAEKFSPNVILRPVFQEMILPDVAFIGGGGELAYWLELKKVFEASNVFFPVLVLRNSFALINNKTTAHIEKLGLQTADLFKSEKQLLEELVKKESDVKLDLQDEKEEVKNAFAKIKSSVSDVDSTLKCHVHSLQTQALHKLDVLEKKMLKAEKKKFDAQQRQILKIKNALYPGGTLQERIDNILPYYAVHGKEIIHTIYNNSKGLDQQFTILTEA
jgi:bacillithiol biosynthesis cysteine-adding enzyme BshC